MRGIIIVGAVVAVLLGGFVTIASLDMKPTTSKVEQTIPDEKLPH